MKIHMLKTMLHDRLGKLKPGRVVDVPDHQAYDWLKRGFAESYQTKVVRAVPLADAGMEAPSSASPAVEASQTETLPKPKRGGRPKKVVQ
jgi:hypothetical protein